MQWFTKSPVLPTLPTRRFSSAASVVQTSCGLKVRRDLPATFDKILIANRGEIACRVIRTCRELGVKTVAIHSEADANAMHVEMADEAYCVGPAAASESYLRMDKVLAVARESGAQAIHPGYGFLSENADFCEKCAQEGIVFIGPPPGAIRDMGSKSASKHIMTAGGVPVVPGYHGEDQTEERLIEEAERVGYPLMIKAVLGGGGKGMRAVNTPGEFRGALAQARGEAMSSFGDDVVLLERYIARSRHIEFQVFADSHGNIVHLNERDCSIQRRNQKVLEEAPAPGMTPELRETMGQSACDAARVVGYEGAGTVEFIVDADTDEYFFMEMNTRLQVEHPVSEMITGQDFVQWQLQAAAGHPLPLTQQEIMDSTSGWSLEARIYAEDPINGFLPSTGRLDHLSTPTSSPSVRVETGVRQGDDVSVFYDPMIAKMVVHSPDREQCLKKMLECLVQFEVVGVRNNIGFLASCTDHHSFRSGKFDTGFIETNMETLLPTEDPNRSQAAMLAAAFQVADDATRLHQNCSRPSDPWNALAGFRMNAFLEDTVRLMDGDEEMCVSVRMENGAVTASCGDSTISGATVDGRRLFASVDGRSVCANVVRTKKVIAVFGEDFRYEFQIPQLQLGGSGKKDTQSRAPMPGKIVELCVGNGQRVVAGDLMLVMEAMKMRHEITASMDGTVVLLGAALNDIVDADQVLVELEPDVLEQQCIQKGDRKRRLTE